MKTLRGILLGTGILAAAAVAAAGHDYLISSRISRIDAELAAIREAVPLPYFMIAPSDPYLAAIRDPISRSIMLQKEKECLTRQYVLPGLWNGEEAGKDATKSPKPYRKPASA